MWLGAIDNFLNSVTMYRLALYVLIAEGIYALLLSLIGQFPFSPIPLIASATILIITSWLTNKLFSKIFKAPINAESYVITALILFFLLAPPNNLNDTVPLLLGATVAMASKYIFAINRKHIFNPAAISAFLLGLFGITSIYWWVGIPSMLPITIIAGLLVVRKIRRFQLFFSFLTLAIISIYFFGFTQQVKPLNLLSQIFTSWPTIFFATIMLTEPQTTPPTQSLRIIYGSFVGFLFGIKFQLGPFYLSPELALVLGNIYSYLVSPKLKLTLFLKEKKYLSAQIVDFVFKPDQKLNFTPGQYLEWTIPQDKTDTRGNRRYFTIASSPTEENLHLGVRISDPGSSFKKALLSLGKSDPLVASQLTGDFTLSKDQNEKLVFIAGGIGITPFRSIIKYLLDTNQKKDIVLFFASASVDDFVYKDLFEKAQKQLGIKTIYILSGSKSTPPNWQGYSGYITKEIIQKEVPDYKNRRYYLSGPQAMVNSYQDLLSKLGISKTKIVTDYFPGY